MGRAGRTYCEDWSCPARWSCARFWGRSEEYWSCSERPVELRRFERAGGADYCPEYRRDVPRPWLAGAGLERFYAGFEDRG